MEQLITLFDEAEAARFPWPAPAPEAAAPTPAPRQLEPEPQAPWSPRASAPHLGFGLTLLFWLGGATFFFITAIAIDMLIQFMR